jgi:ankyrin repeat protein
MRVAKNGQTGAAKLLLGVPGTDANAKDVCGQTSLTHAVRENRTEIVRQLLNAREIDVNIASTDFAPLWEFVDIGRTALMVASAEGRAESVKHLLTAPGIDVDFVSASGQTALSLASDWRRTEVAELLLALS